MALYPLLLERHLDSRLWGGQKLAPFLNLPKPYPQRIAESWQVFDTNRILNGPLKGVTLAEATRKYGKKLVGTISPTRYGADLPLLAKFIDAQQDLSVQVHPDDAYAHRVEAETGFHGKSEAWYILKAEPRASLFYHLSKPVTRDEFEGAVRAKTLTRLLNRRAVKAGDVLFVPAGTVHTINAGIMLFEIQQKSDLTYRVFDYGRGRPLHLEKALDVIAFDRPPPPTVHPLPLTPEGDQTLLLASQHFSMERWQITGRVTAETRPTSLEILTVIAGSGRLNSLALDRGTSVVLPASLGAYTLSPSPQGSEQNERPTQPLTLIRCTVPDLERDIVCRLRALNYDDAQIAGVVREN